MMLAHKIFALISEQEVKNTIICDQYHVADGLAKNIYNNEAFAVEITQIPTAIGHSYIDGLFRDLDGNVVVALPTTEDEVIILKSQNNELNQALTETTLLLATQEEIAKQQSEAITELSMLRGGVSNV